MDGKGNDRRNDMYHYIDDKEFLKKLRSCCSDIINQLVQQINNEGKICVEAHLVGSGARNMIAQNADEPVDLDYNLCILETRAINMRNEKALKNYIKSCFNDVLQRNRWGDCQDSTSALTTERRQFTKGNPTEFSIDLAITCQYNGCWYRLIHDKTGFWDSDRWFWNEVPNSSNIFDRSAILKSHHLWTDVRSLYLGKKNMYLRRQDHNHPSFVIYIETINEVYYQHFRHY